MRCWRLSGSDANPAAADVEVGTGMAADREARFRGAPQRHSAPLLGTTAVSRCSVWSLGMLLHCFRWPDGHVG